MSRFDPRTLDRRALEHWALALLLLTALVVWALLPTYPDYDSYHHLNWGRGLLEGLNPGFEEYAAPTPHPLFLALSALLSLAGDFADRLLVLSTLLSLAALTAGTYVLSRELFGWQVGAAAAVLVGSRFGLYSLRAFVDVPFLALVVWAAALEASRPRRGLAPMALLAVAGLVRPEAWVLAGLYWLWCWPGRSTRSRLALLALAAAAPVCWALVDLVVTGDALFSLTNTGELAAALDRVRGIENVPSAFARYLPEVARPPVALGGIIGLVLAWRRYGPRRLAVPLALLGSGALTFIGIGVAGLSIIPRYLTVPAVALSILAAYAVMGFTTLEAGPERVRWRRAAVGMVVLGFAFLAVKIATFERLYNELRFLDRTHEAVVGLLAEPKVKDGMRRCGEMTFPTYRVVPDVRWQLDDDANAFRVHSRVKDPALGPVAVFIDGDEKFEERLARADGVPRSTNALPAREPTLRHGPFLVYIDC